MLAQTNTQSCTHTKSHTPPNQWTSPTITCKRFHGHADTIITNKQTNKQTHTHKLQSIFPPYFPVKHHPPQGATKAMEFTACGKADARSLSGRLKLRSSKIEVARSRAKSRLRPLPLSVSSKALVEGQNQWRSQAHQCGVQ